MDEIWLPVKSYDGFFEKAYEVSDKGRIRSLDRISDYGNGKFVFTKGRVLIRNSKRYVLVNLCYNGRKQPCQLHRLIAEVFIPNPENKPYVNHKDGIKWNNCVSNLEWSTHKENEKHASENGLKASGERNGCSKLTYELVSEIRNKYKPHIYTNRMLSKEYNMSYHEIQLINQGKRWSCPKSILSIQRTIQTSH